MNQDVTRREAFKVLATGAAGAAIGAAGVGEAATITASTRTLAAVSHCRSWSREVCLQVSEQMRGFVTLTAEGFALAAACQAAGRPVAVRFWGHQPQFLDGAGRFDGAVVAVNLRDLPGESASSIM